MLNKWINILRRYLRQFIELGLLLIGVSVFAEILFGPDVAFFGSQVTKNLVALLNTLGDSGIAALIVIFALLVVYRKVLK
tara:strand:- start:74 stop:313 length:240 start_codon:yes stop_codon:yes gene_type:complete